jgi:hypothetical protein
MRHPLLWHNLPRSATSIEKAKGGGSEGHSLPRFTIGITFTQCDPFGIPSTSHWTAAAIIVQ